MKHDELVAHFGSAETLFVWASDTQTDIKSYFDVPDVDFDILKRRAKAEGFDIVNIYGYEYTDNGGIKCGSCGHEYNVADGSIMRGHAKRCAVNPAEYHVPAVCDA